MVTSHYDIVIVGAGPAGLSAARTAARLGFSTLLLEQLSRAGHTQHPCSGILTPVPGLISARRLLDQLFFPSLDLLLPPALVMGYPPVQRFISPSGYEFRAEFGGPTDTLAAVVDKPALLRFLAGQAESAGAELRFGTPVRGLLEREGRVVGVRTDDEEVGADMVLSAEGVSRRLAQQVGLYRGTTPRRYGVLLGQEFSAPAVTAEHLGQVVTLGRRFTSATQAYGTLVLPAPGRASVYFTLYADTPQLHDSSLPWFYLDEYVQKDPRVRDYLAGAHRLGRVRQDIVVQDASAQAGRPGVLALGDAITPAGHLGILPAIYTGRQAVLFAAEAIDSVEDPLVHLKSYEDMLQHPLLANLEAESRIMACLTHMSDEEVDRLCQSLASLRAPTPFFSNWRTLTWEMMGWIVRQFPGIAHNWNDYQCILAGSPAQVAGTQAFP